MYNTLTRKEDYIINKIKGMFYAKGYTVVENNNIMYPDSSILFVNSPIIFYKEKMIQGEKIGKVLHIQEVVRTRQLKKTPPSYSLYFTLIGLIGDYEFKEQLFYDYLDVLDQIFLIKPNELYGTVEKNCEDLKELWGKYLNISKLCLLLSKTNKIKLDWSYGKEFPITGKGITILANIPKILKCSIDCSILCECNKYKTIGDAIEISKNGKKEYFEIGLGYERTLSATLDGSEFSVSNRKPIIEYAVKEGFPKSTARDVLGIMEAIYIIILNGVSLSNNKQGFILKKLIRTMYFILLKNCCYDYNDIKQKYLGFNKAWKKNYFFDVKINDIILNEFEKTQSNVQSGYKKFIKLSNEEHIDFKYFSGTLGIPEFIILKWLNDSNNKFTQNGG